MTKHVVVLIHGTWGGDSSWLQSGSSLRAHALEALGCPNCPERDCCVRFEVFRWSGRNSISARLRAAKRLRKRIGQLREDYPEAALHAIAHSHGGNVAFYALKDEPISLDSLTCLSTPFLIAVPRTMDEATGRLLRSALSIITLTFLAGLGALLIFAYSVLAEMYSLTPPSVVIDRVQASLGGAESFLFVAIATGILLVFFEAGWILLHRRAHRLAEKIDLPMLRTTVLIIRGGGDEAHATLEGAQLISTLVTKLLHVALRVFGTRTGELRLVSRTVRSAILAGVMFVLLAPFAAAEKWIHLIPFLTFGPLIVMMLSLFVIGLALVLLAFVAFLFGGMATAALSLYISVEGTPRGVWQVEQLKPLAYEQGRRLTLRHYTHSDERALDRLARFLRTQAKSE